SGGQTFGWGYKDGHAVRTELETGVSDGNWVEVTHRRVPASEGSATGEVAWTPIDGSEQVILGDLSILTEGSPVRVAPATSGAAVAVAPRPEPRGPTPTGGR